MVNIVVFLVWCFTIGAVLGSTYSTLVYRLHTHQSVISRSKCDNCNHVIAFYELVPIVSYTLLRGRCRYCNTTIENTTLKYEIVCACITLGIGLICLRVL